MYFLQIFYQVCIRYAGLNWVCKIKQNLTALNFEQTIQIHVARSEMKAVNFHSKLVENIAIFDVNFLHYMCRYMFGTCLKLQLQAIGIFISASTRYVNKLNSKLSTEQQFFDRVFRGGWHSHSARNCQSKNEPR